MGKIEKTLVKKFPKYARSVIMLILAGYFINSFKIASDYDKYVMDLKIAQYDSDVENAMLKGYFTAHQVLKEIEINPQQFLIKENEETSLNLGLVIKSTVLQRAVDRFDEYVKTLPEGHADIPVNYFSHADTTLPSGISISEISAEELAKFPITTVLVLDETLAVRAKVAMPLHREEYIESMVSKFLLDALEHK